MADELTAIPALEERYRRTLTQRLGITSYRALADADSQEVFRAMSRNRPPPRLSQVREWQREARRRLDSDPADPAGWEQVASFVVSFEQRLVEGVKEQRLMAEQTELEPEQPPVSWPGWDGAGLADWLQDKVSAAGLALVAEESEPAIPESVTTPATAEQEHMSRASELHIESVAVVDPSGRTEAVAGGRLTGLRLEGTLPARIEIRVTGGAPGSELRAALRIRKPGGPSWSPEAPIRVRSQHTAKIELSEAAVGLHRARVVAWALDASAEPAGVDLGDLSISAA